ncbi:MAG: flagellin [Lawsonibacter sp.]|nr:flagellin [Lawsonibacter sp.]
MTATFDGTNWTVAGAPTGWTAAFDGTNLTITSDTTGATGDADHDFGTITATVACVGTAGVTATAADTYTDGTDAVAGGGAGGGAAADTITGSFKIGNNAYDDIDLSGKTTTEDIAKAVFKELGSADGTAKATDVDLFDNGTLYDVERTGSKLTFTLKSDPTEKNIAGNFDWDLTATDGSFKGNHTAGTNVITAGSVESAGVRANTVFEITANDLKDGTVIELDGKKVTLSVGPNSTVKAGEGVVKLTSTEAADLNLALSKISEGFGGETDNFTVSVNNGENGDTKTGLAIYKKADSKKTYTTMDELAGVFSMSVAADDADKGNALKLQIGDTSDSYNQLEVSIGDMHTAAMGIANLSIAKQTDAAAAIQTIRNAINYVSGVRGDLGATQNRLEHTANNLSVMAENIQDAESTIRDTDIAEEMMSYTKNNILVQSAQAMLAQANQVPQGVLQLLG